MVGEPLFDKIVILSGTSGVGLAYFLSTARRLFGSTAFYADFEDYVKETSKTGIYTIASSLLWSPKSSLDVFHDAYKAMVHDALEARDSGARIAFVETHLSYLSTYTTIPNPVIDKIISLGKEAILIYYIEDFYHALLRMAQSIIEKPHLYRAETFTIDPLSYMTWRGLDHSLLNMLKARYEDKLETIIVGVKHPEETHKRVLEYASLPRVRGRRLFMLSYISHPITAIRKEYTILKKEGRLSSIWDHVFVKGFEEFKRKLIHECPKIILFEPTTIDELSGEVSASEEDGYVVRLEDRWPHARIKDYERMYPVDIFDPEVFALLYGGGFSESSPKITTSILDWSEARRYYLKRLEWMIKEQIEVRDYEYVSQSSSVIAYEPLYKYRYLEGYSRSRGATKELARAESQSKAIYVVTEHDAASKFASESQGLFGEKINPIILGDPSDPKELVEVLGEAGFC